jgi:rRNA maturation RNase YbeY
MIVVRITNYYEFTNERIRKAFVIRAMSTIPINFFKEDIAFRLLQQRELQQWVAGVIKAKRFTLIQINYIFCSDAYLLKLNKDYLHHNTYTDIITFRNSPERKKVEADIFISYERVKINAVNYGTPVKDELHRVMIHGVLHLLGYKDKSVKDKNLMRKMENKMLALRSASN